MRTNIQNSLFAALCAAASLAAADMPKAVQAAPQDSAANYQWQTIAQGLDHPWAMAFLPEGGYLLSERSGQLRRVSAAGEISAPIEGLPAIDAGGQGGLLDIILDEDFAANRRLYFCYSEAGEGGNSTALASAALSADGRRLEALKPLFSQQPKINSRAHFGCRIVLSGDYLYLGLGERYSHKEQAQSLDNHLGKLLRLHRDGSIPADNPFAGRSGARPEIWSYGHRNIQGMGLDAQGRLFAIEHGPQGGDEINLIEAGKNYGWPVITYGENYGGGKIGSGTAQDGMEQPIYYWTPSIAPSGLQFVGANPYGADWQGNLLVGALKAQYLARLQFTNGGINEEKIPVGERVRAVYQGPDGFIYIITDENNGKLLKLLP